jgi:hypothetical protein
MNKKTAVAVITHETKTLLTLEDMALGYDSSQIVQERSPDCLASET